MLPPDDDWWYEPARRWRGWPVVAVVLVALVLIIGAAALSAPWR